MINTDKSHSNTRIYIYEFKYILISYMKMKTGIDIT